MSNDATRQELLNTLRRLEDEADHLRDIRMVHLCRLQELTREIERLHRHISLLDRREEEGT